ncbi:MAG: MFS transporter [Anaerolineae bacterium]|nr:MFS transporter [Anaerolineae bacterium]
MNNPALTAWRQRLAPEWALHIVGLGVAISLLGDLTLYVVLPTHTKEAGIVLANVGLMLSANRLIRLFINGPLGVIIERIPRRRIAVPALFFGALSSLLYTVPGFWPLLIGRLLWGTAWAGIWLSASTMALDLSTFANRGRFVGRLQMWFFLGSGGAALAGGALTDWLGYSAALRVCSAITLIAALLWLLLLPETQPAHPSRSPAAEHAQPGMPAPPPNKRLPLAVAIALLGVNWLIFIGILGAVLPLLLEDRIGETVRVAGTIIYLSTFTGAMAAGSQALGLLASPLSGWLSDLTGNRWRLVIFALVLGAASMALTAGGRGVVVVTAIMLSSIATSVLQTQVMTLVGDYAGENSRGRILGIINTIGDGGSAAGPLIAYALLPLVTIGGLFWLATGILLAALPGALWIARQEARELRAGKVISHPRPLPHEEGGA